MDNEDALVDKLSKELEDLPDEWLVSVLVDATYALKADLILLKYFVNRREMNGVYVCIDRPYSYIGRLLERHGIDPMKIYFIDAISQLSGCKPQERENVTFVKGPFDLTSLSRAINIAFPKKSEKPYFLLVDNIATLQLYNSVDSIGRFAHFVSGKLREMGIYGVIVMLENEMDKKLISLVNRFCDKRIVMVEEWFK